MFTYTLMALGWLCFSLEHLSGSSWWGWMSQMSVLTDGQLLAEPHGASQCCFWPERHRPVMERQRCVNRPVCHLHCADPPTAPPPTTTPRHSAFVSRPAVCMCEFIHHMYCIIHTNSAVTRLCRNTTHSPAHCEHAKIFLKSQHPDTDSLISNMDAHTDSPLI